MMISVEKEDWIELIQALKNISEKTSSWVDVESDTEEIAESQKLLQSFHTTAAMLGLQQLEEAGVALEKYLLKPKEPGSNGEVPSNFNLAVDALLTRLENTHETEYHNVSCVEEITSILEGAFHAPPESTTLAEKDVLPTPESLTELSKEETRRQVAAGDADHSAAGFDDLDQIVSKLGGQLIINRETAENGKGSFQLHFPSDPDILKRIGTLLAPCDPNSQFASQLNNRDTKVEAILTGIKKFMNALSSGNLAEAQEILLSFQEKQQQAGLFVEIGTLARDLHNSLKSFMNTMDPALKDLVMDKLPDSGNRLEHILQITEHAATTTLDHVESLQKRNQMDQANLEKLQKILSGLKAIGEPAQARLTDSGTLLDQLSASAIQTRDDLITILTAQDYQDLTGQIILKIINLLNDLQLKMVNLIRTFGVAIDDRKKTQSEELYGPAHQGKLGALHSQDDVDNLLAEFGF
ncbi:protein phosphatase CheZ [Desulforhabdus amnigena]|jgi:chemotaxis protein CheZ|uniref:Protein phosphatase CheZ n=1 Tax=Desulforhabdus amnigena TaxID=40218 RepID=A0A9W6D236_9BACT|nr:protein phosphatase CheZ [Desulforhabdus amnigena]NLJ27641.1 protein phosphatase CheZ [Deltaproteobacteria bacterium]GLI33549.1 hypothetical protein DAMNIGENAA_09820 [Desulforhabdus amnigena]